MSVKRRPPDRPHRPSVDAAASLLRPLVTLYPERRHRFSPAVVWSTTLSGALGLGMIETFCDFDPPIEQLFRLANTSFEPSIFQSACDSFAELDRISTDDDLWNYRLEGNARMIVSLIVEVVGAKPNGWPDCRPLSVACAILSICWWQRYSLSDHGDEATFLTEREEFDRLYGDALARTTASLGLPQMSGIDADNCGYRYSIWRGNTGLLILQQSARDPQFGHDINYWIQPWTGRDPTPTTPFIDWLCQLQFENASTPPLPSPPSPPSGRVQ